MRAKEFLTEQQLRDVHDALDIANKSLPYTYKLTDLQNQDFYEIYRFGVALAAVRGESGNDDVMNNYKPSFEAESLWGENQIVSGFDPNLKNVVKDALKKVKKSGIKSVSTPGSDEMDDTNRSSPIKAFRGYTK
jgi:hypothetical protein